MSAKKTITWLANNVYKILVVKSNNNNSRSKIFLIKFINVKGYSKNTFLLFSFINLRNGYIFATVDFCAYFILHHNKDFLT